MSPVEKHPDAQPSPDAASAGQLSLGDAVSLVIGIVIGTAIFRSTADVFANTRSPAEALAAWVLGGALSFAGALCYAELGTTYPRSGGDYVYLTRAYGRWAGFLFGWMQLSAILTSSIGTMAYTFADYGVRLAKSPARAAVWMAAAAVVALTLANAWDRRLGPRTQVLLTAAKACGLACVLVAGIVCALGEGAAPAAGSGENAPLVRDPSFGLAMVFVLFAYGGWSDSAFVAAEVENRQRNVPRALLGGVAAITLIYLAMNAAYLAALGFERAQRSPTPAADVLEAAAGRGAAALVSVLVMISALGAINGMILTGSRLYAALGADHRVLGWLGRRSPRDGVPRAALAAQAAMILAMIFGVGTEWGRSSFDAVLSAVGAPGIPWDRYYGGFETLLAATAPLFWGLLLATGTAMMVLRRREPARPRPFSVPLYPLPPLAFCATCGYLMYHSLMYAGWLIVLGLGPAALGLAIYGLSRGSGGGARHRDDAG